MSGCHPTEMSYEEKEVSEMFFSGLSNKLNAQQDVSHMVMKVQELENKINEIVDFDNSIKESMTTINFRINAIVKDYNECNMRRIEDNKELKNRIKEIERFQDITHLEYKAKKLPHKCPICEGTTFCREGMCCVPCDGTGIVWG